MPSSSLTLWCIDTVSTWWSENTSFLARRCWVVEGGGVSLSGSWAGLPGYLLGWPWVGSSTSQCLCRLISAVGWWTHTSQIYHRFSEGLISWNIHSARNAVWQYSLDADPLLFLLIFGTVCGSTAVYCQLTAPGSGVLSRLQAHPLAGPAPHSWELNAGLGASWRGKDPRCCPGWWFWNVPFRGCGCRSWATKCCFSVYVTEMCFKAQICTRPTLNLEPPVAGMCSWFDSQLWARVSGAEGSFDRAAFGRSCLFQEKQVLCPLRLAEDQLALPLQSWAIQLLNFPLLFLWGPLSILIRWACYRPGPEDGVTDARAWRAALTGLLVLLRAVCWEGVLRLVIKLENWRFKLLASSPEINTAGSTSSECEL